MTEQALPIPCLLELADDPALPALVDGEGSMTRGDLWAAVIDRAAAIADTVGPDHRVMLADTADRAAVVNVLGAVVAGRSLAMVPHDPGTDVTALAAAARCAVALRGDELEPLQVPDDVDEATDPRYGTGATGSTEALLLYTSGTTSLPRGVRLSHRNVVSNLTAMLRITPPWDSKDRFGMVLALTHSFGLSMTMLALTRRTPVVLLGGGVPSRSLAARFDDDQVTVLACVPYYLRLLVRRGLHLGGDFGHHVSTLYLAGGGISDHELGQVLPRFTGERFLMYGFTEATARVAVRRAGDGAPANSVGLPLPGSHVEIVTPDGAVLPPGAEGHIRIDSPSLMIGYLGEEPRAAGTPFTTTDLGHLDDYGHLFVTGREAEMLNFRGNRVSAVVVEAAVSRIEGVLDARLVPDARDEDAQCLLRVVARDDADHGAIRRQVLRTVEPKGMVREVEFVDQLETTRSGKPLRRV